MFLHAFCKLKERNSKLLSTEPNRFCGLVVRVPSYISRGPRFDSRRYQIFWEVVGLERCPLSLMSTIEELLGRNNSSSSLETRECGCRDPSCWPHYTHYLQKLALTSLSGGHSVGIVHSWTRATEFIFVCCCHFPYPPCPHPPPTCHPLSSNPGIGYYGPIMRQPSAPHMSIQCQHRWFGAVKHIFVNLKIKLFLYKCNNSKATVPVLTPCVWF
jgi:hypothetical protein